MHLKCNKAEESDAWTEALKALVDVYSNKVLVDFDINRQYKDKVDIRISNMIMAELETNNKKYILPAMECKRFLEDKGILSYINDFPAGFMENRVHYGKIKRTSCSQVAQDIQAIGSTLAATANGGAGAKEEKPINLGSNVVLPSSMFWDDMCAVVITSKSYDDEKPDQELLDGAKLPAWMKVDTLYLFKWEKNGDASTFIKEYEAKDFLMVEPMSGEGMKSKYNLRIEMRDYIEFIGTQFAIEI